MVQGLLAKRHACSSGFADGSATGHGEAPVVLRESYRTGISHHLYFQGEGSAELHISAQGCAEG
jgi:hypothetical protein